MRGEKVHSTPHLPHRHKCVCMRGQGITFAFLPGVRTLPLPAESWGQARCPQWNLMYAHGGGGVRRRGYCCIYLWWLCCEGCVQIWLRGNLCPPHLYHDPGSDPSLSSLFYHKDAWRPWSISIWDSQTRRQGVGKVRCLKRKDWGWATV